MYSCTKKQAEKNTETSVSPTMKNPLFKYVIWVKTPHPGFQNILVHKGTSINQPRPVSIDPKLLWSSCGKPLPFLASNGPTKKMGAVPKIWQKLGGGNSNIFLFSPRTLGRWSNLTIAYFSEGLVQPPTRKWRFFFFFSSELESRALCCCRGGDDPWWWGDFCRGVRTIFFVAFWLKWLDSNNLDRSNSISKPLTTRNRTVSLLL